MIDVSNPGVPVEVGSLATPDLALGVTVVGDFAYVADRTSGMLVIDVSNPATPREIGSIDTPGWATSVSLAGGLAYVADGSSGLRVILPAVPGVVGSFNTYGKARGVAVVGGLAYLADAQRDLRVIDISNPAAPIEVGSATTTVSAVSVAALGGLAYVTDTAGLRVIEAHLVPEPGSLPLEIASLATMLTLHVRRKRQLRRLGRPNTSRPGGHGCHRLRSCPETGICAACQILCRPRLSANVRPVRGWVVMLMLTGGAENGASAYPIGSALGLVYRSWVVR